MRVTRGGDAHIQWGARLADALAQNGVSKRHTGVEAFAERLASIEDVESLNQGGVQVAARRIVFVQMIGYAQCDPDQCNKVARGLIDLHQSTRAHQ